MQAQNLHDLLHFREKVERLADKKDFTDYISLLKSIVNLATQGPKHTNWEVSKIYCAYFSFVDRPKAFENITQLKEADRLHAKISIFNVENLNRRFMDQEIQL